MGYSKFIKHSLYGVALATSFSTIANTTIDVMVLYSDGFASQYGAGVDTRINQVISVNNNVYQDSQLDVVNTAAIQVDSLSLTCAQASDTNEKALSSLTSARMQMSNQRDIVKQAYDAFKVLQAV